MKKYLLPEQGTFYKANLHCHSTISDGSQTPEEIKRDYMEQGYSIVAFTDHDIFLTHPELREENFLPLNGFEVEINEDKPWPYCRTCHICFVALDEHNDIHPLWHRTDYLFGNAPKYRDQARFDPEKPDYVRSYTPECISDMMRIGREAGFFVTYNHPKWSRESYPEYSKYENMSAMEICNWGCLHAGYADYNPEVYDDLLKQGKKLFVIAADDNHSAAPAGSAGCDRFGGFIQIKAEKLDYPTIAKALQNGDFYASQGPEIHELWFDTEKSEIHVKTSPAVQIYCTSEVRRVRNARMDNDAEFTEAVFPVYKDEKYVRISVRDAKGYFADTNAYFTDDLFA